MAWDAGHGRRRWHRALDRHDHCPDSRHAERSRGGRGDELDDVTIDNLTRLQITTTDVDEYLLPYVRVGQTVIMTVEALDGRELTGQVRTVAIKPRLNATGDAYYPVIIDPNGSTSGLKPGTSVDITFPN